MIFSRDIGRIGVMSELPGIAVGLGIYVYNFNFSTRESACSGL